MGPCLRRDDSRGLGDSMHFFVKLLGLSLFIISYNAFGIGDLTVTNTTLGLARFKIIRNGQMIFRSPAIEPGNVFKKSQLLNTGDVITFPVADNTRGPLLPEDYIVGSLHGRTANVTITCKGDHCDSKED